MEAYDHQANIRRTRLHQTPGKVREVHPPYGSEIQEGECYCQSPTNFLSVIFWANNQFSTRNLVSPFSYLSSASRRTRKTQCTLSWVFWRRVRLSRWMLASWDWSRPVVRWCGEDMRRSWTTARMMGVLTRKSTVWISFSWRNANFIAVYSWFRSGIYNRTEFKIKADSFGGAF